MERLRDAILHDTVLRSRLEQAQTQEQKIVVLQNAGFSQLEVKQLATAVSSLVEGTLFVGVPPCK